MEVYLMFTICDKSRRNEFLEQYKKLHIERSYIASCEGLASFDIIDYLGLQQSKKSLIISFVTVDNFKKVKKNLINRLDIDRPGHGVVFICPLSSFGGKRELNLCLQGQKISERKDAMKDNKNELIVTIANSGYSNTIMTSARKNGAKGGTLIHGKSAGNNEIDNFLGVSLVAEKEIILIVTGKKDKNQIMSSIIEECGIETKAGAVCFSLPVDDLCGFSLLDE